MFFQNIFFMFRKQTLVEKIMTIFILDWTHFKASWNPKTHFLYISEVNNSTHCVYY